MDNTTISAISSGLVRVPNSFSWLLHLPWLLASLFGYPLLQHYFRFQRLRTMMKKYNYQTRQSMEKMTDREAWEIMNDLAELEFPNMFEKGIQATRRGNTNRIS